MFVLTLIFGSCIVLGSSHVSVAPVGKGALLDVDWIAFAYGALLFDLVGSRVILNCQGLKRNLRYQRS